MKLENGGSIPCPFGPHVFCMHLCAMRALKPEPEALVGTYPQIDSL